MGRFSFSLLAGVDVLLKRPILVFLSYHQAEGGKRTLYLIAIAKFYKKPNVKETSKNYFMDLVHRWSTPALPLLGMEPKNRNDDENEV